ncbi:rhomboid family intramembrane serine protease [Treponema sp.]|uniref:rhomboid family intramembrane serine protease n=1 Tax=Treponema sp. TaxID=166 RepID=UPI003F03AE8A
MHDGWNHFIGNCLFIIPASLMIENLCRKTGCPILLIFVIMIIHSFISIIPIWFNDDMTVCGMSGNALMLLEMAFVWFGMRSEKFGKVWFTAAIIELIITIYTDKMAASNYKFGLIFGLAFGALCGFGLHSLFA